MKNRIDLNTIPEEFEWNDNEAVVVRENGWFKADMTCTTKSAKVALNRFFKAVPELESWKAEIVEAIEYGCYKNNDLTMADGTKNHCPTFAYEIDMTNSGEDEFSTVYIFFNVNEAARGGLE